MEGWIKIHRKILENPIICKDSDYLSVWIYLLVNATHREIPALFKGKKIILKPGQLITGRKTIARDLNISESKVYRVINEYKSEHQIEQQTSNKNSLITILNWNEYQQNKQQNEQQMNNKRTTTEHKQEYKEYNNIYLFLFNKYKEQFSCEKTLKEKQEIFKKIMQENNYKDLSEYEQTKLYTELINII